jgi:hypothetical protein
MAMANGVFRDGAIFKGELNMFEQAFSYLFTIQEVTESGFRFKHKLAVESLNMVVDEKEGDGTWSKVDENIVKLKFSDPETSFEGDLNVNSGEIFGEANQSSGIFLGTKGKFNLKYDSQQ